jgi:hypothetical protein
MVSLVGRLKACDASMLQPYHGVPSFLVTTILTEMKGRVGKKETSYALGALERRAEKCDTADTAEFLYKDVMQMAAYCDEDELVREAERVAELEAELVRDIRDRKKAEAARDLARTRSVEGASGLLLTRKSQPTPSSRTSSRHRASRPASHSDPKRSNVITKP